MGLAAYLQRRQDLGGSFCLYNWATVDEIHTLATLLILEDHNAPFKRHHLQKTGTADHHSSNFFKPPTRIGKKRQTGVYKEM